MHDLISRQDAIDAFKKELTVGESKGNYVTICSAVGYEGAKQILERLPSAERKGEWIRENVVLTSNPPQYQWHCSECGGMVHGFTTEVLTKYCPNCGADMRG